ncbi:MAG: hypothetical protein ACREIW_07840, partial [Chthoniobacterales bacterium]
MPDSRKFIAYSAPFVMFVILFGLAPLSRVAGWSRLPEFWIYPIQAIASGALVIFFWRDYRMRRPAKMGFAIVVGVIVFVLWVAPQQFLGFTPRPDGFNPDFLAANSAQYWATV